MLSILHYFSVSNSSPNPAVIFPRGVMDKNFFRNISEFFCCNLVAALLSLGHKVYLDLSAAI